MTRRAVAPVARPGLGVRPARCPGGTKRVGRYASPVTERLCLMTVHAHPDDEASKGAATVAKYHDHGVRTVLVCCTGGEQGDILNPAMDRPEVRADLPAVRRHELEQSTAVIGYDEVVLLGYRDSGMPGTEANEDPASFARAPLEEAVGRLVAVIRRERPQVIVTYDEDQRGYPHPDHLRVHDVSVAAFDAAADPVAYPEAGPAWRVRKLYYVGFSGERVLAMHAKFVELGRESPFDDAWLERARSNKRAYTTRIDVSDYADVRRKALLAHATQIDPESPFWFGLPPEVMRGVHPFDEYVLARLAGMDDGVEAGAGDPGSLRTAADGAVAGSTGKDQEAAVEDDLFAGVRQAVSR